MSIDNALEALREKAKDVSKRIYEKRCRLASSAGDDTRCLMDFSHLEGLLEGFEDAISEVRKHLDTETKLPASANWSVGEDINVPTTPPAWIKRGQWVMDRDGQLWKIVGFAHGLLQVVLPNKAAAHIGSWQELKPVKFRKYSFEEAMGLLGKVIKCFLGNEKHRQAIVITDVTDSDGCGLVNWHSHTYWTEKNATIDDIPIGVPEVDEEAERR